MGDEMKQLVQERGIEQSSTRRRSTSAHPSNSPLDPPLPAHLHAFEDGMIALAQAADPPPSLRFVRRLSGYALRFESWIAELHVSSALDAMIKKQTLYRRETLTFENHYSLSKKLVNLRSSMKSPPAHIAARSTIS